MRGYLWSGTLPAIVLTEKLSWQTQACVCTNVTTVSLVQIIIKSSISTFELPDNQGWPISVWGSAMHTAIPGFRIRHTFLVLLSALAIIVQLAGCALGGSPASSTTATGSVEAQEEKAKDNSSSESGSATSSNASATQQKQPAASTKEANSSAADESKKGEDTSGTGLWIMSKAVVSVGDSRDTYDYELDEHGNVLSERHTRKSSSPKYDLDAKRTYSGMDEHGLWTLEEGDVVQGSSSYTTSYPYAWRLDGEGRPILVTYQSDEYAGVVNYEWGVDGWLVGESTERHDGDGHSITEIDEKGLIVKTAAESAFNPGGVDCELSYSYDDSGRPVSCTIETINRETGEVIQNAAERESIEYDEHGNVVRIVAEDENPRYGATTIEMEYTYVEDPSLWATQMQRLCWQSTHPTQWHRRLF